MNEYREKQTLFKDQDQPIKRARPVVGAQYDAAVHEHRAQEHRTMSGGAIAALVIASVAAAIAITVLIMNGQQRNRDDELAQERAKSAAAQQAAIQPPQQPPVVATQPLQQSPAVAAPSPQAAPVSATAPSQSESTTAPPRAELEMEVASKLVDDPQLRSYQIEVKVEGGTATLSGHLPDDGLRVRAEIIARTVKGVRRIVNNIVVQPD